MKRFYRFLATMTFILAGFCLNAQEISIEADTTEGCAPFTVNMTNVSDLTGYDTTGLYWVWYFEDEWTPTDTGYHMSHTYTNPDHYSVRVVAHQRSDDMDVGGGSGLQINVDGVPDTFWVSAGYEVCPNEEIYFSLSSGHINPNWMKWEYGDGTYGTQYYEGHSYDTPGDYEVLMIMEAGGYCVDVIDTVIETITVSNSAVPIKPNAGAHGGGQFCPGDNVGFWLDRSENYDSISWHFGDGTTSDEQSPEHAYTVGGKQVIVEVFNSCGQTNSDTFNLQILSTIEVNPSFDYWNNGGYCPGNQISFNAHGTGTYLWDFGDGEISTDRSPIHFFVDTGTYKVKFVISNNCGDIDSSEQSVYIGYDPYNNPPWPEVHFDIDNMEWNDTTITVCPGKEVPFRNETWLEDGSGASFKWEFGDGTESDEFNTSHSWASEGDFEVLMIVTNNCLASDTGKLYVTTDASITPVVELMLFQDSICPGDKMYFVPDGDGEGLTFSLWYGDGASDLDMTDGNDPNLSGVFTHTYASTGEYIYRMEATNLCGNTTVVVEDTLVVADHVEMPFLMVMNSTSDMQDPSIDLIPKWDIRQSANDFEFNTPITWSAWKEGDEDKFTIAFFDEIPDGDDISPIGLVSFSGPGDATAFIPTDQGFDTVYAVAVWYCDGILNTYDEPHAMGFYEGFIELSSAGSLTLDFPGLVMEYSERWEGECDDNSACPGDTVAFFAVGGVSYDWDLGDGTLVSGSVVKHVYADTGLYEASVEITDGCGSTYTLSSPAIVGDYNTPDAWIDIDNDNICVGDTIRFNENDWDGDDPTQVYNETYFWDFGDGNTSTEKKPLHTYQDAGSYEITLTVTNGCGSYTTDDRYIWVDGPIIEFSVADTTVLQGDMVSFTNETQNAVSYDWDFGNDSTSSQKDPSVEYPIFGQYSVTLTARSNKGCEVSLEKPNYLLVINTPSVSNVLVTDIDCNGDDNGSVDITVTGGQPPYSYIWSPGGATTQDIDGLAANTYLVTITDNFGTEVVRAYLVDEPNALASTINNTPITCFGGSDGELDADITGGTGAYTYNWSTNETTDIISDLTDGRYYLTVTDENDCELIDSADVVSASSEIDIPIWTNSTSACGVSDGDINAGGVSGGDGGPYSYVWDILPDPGDVASINGSLAVGTYTVTVTDGGGCVDSASASVTEGSAPNAWINEETAISCDEGSNGEIQAFTDGTPATYEWDIVPDPGNVALVSGLSAGTYSVTITDVSTCKSAAFITLGNPDTLIVQISGTDPTCPGSSTGEATANAFGGDGNYSYEWPFGWTQQTNINLLAGTYEVTVTDNGGGGCIATQSITLNDPVAMSVSTDIYNAAVRDSSDGAINLTVHDGTAPYTYAWSNGPITQDIDNIPAGVYDVTVTDANMCEGIFTGHTVGEPDLLSVDILTNRSLPMCSGETVTLDAGAGYVAYQWSTGETSQTITVDTGMVFAVKAIGNASYGYDTLDVIVQYPFDSEEICVVTIDLETGKNAIVWEKTPDVGTDYYVIYREGTIVNQYDSIGTIHYDSLTVFVDLEGNNKNNAYQYKLGLVDTCGNMSELSYFHKAMLLQSSRGTSNEINLNWTTYGYEGGGFTFDSYEILRGTDSSSLAVITTVAASNSSYIDSDPIVQTAESIWYLIAGVKPDTCDPAGLLGKKANAGPFSRSLSNLEDNRQQSSGIIPNVANQFNLSAYPNPYNSYTNITYTLNTTADVKLEVYDLVGKKVGQIVNETQSQGVYEYRFSAAELGLSSGIYYMNFEADDHKVVKKLVEIQ